MGEIAIKKPEENDILSGILLKKNFSYHIFAAEDIPSKTIFKTIINLNFLSIEKVVVV